MNRSRARLLAVVMILAACGAAGCHNKVRMKYDARHQMIVPVLSTGDVIEWTNIDPTIISWQISTPCKEATPERLCTIAAGHSGKTFSFKCKDDSCDPEIAVDDSAGTILTYGTRGRGQATSASGVKRIKFGCDKDNELQIIDAVNIGHGDVVDWLPVGLANATWSVTFLNQRQSAACGHDGIINNLGNNCTATTSDTYRYQLSLATHCAKTKEADLKIR